MRLNQVMNYKIDFLATLQDEYGQKLTKMSSVTAKTGPTAEKDKYLYSSAQ